MQHSKGFPILSRVIFKELFGTMTTKLDAKCKEATGTGIWTGAARRCGGAAASWGKGGRKEKMRGGKLEFHL